MTALPVRLQPVGLFRRQPRCFRLFRCLLDSGLYQDSSFDRSIGRASCRSCEVCDTLDSETWWVCRRGRERRCRTRVCRRAGSCRGRVCCRSSDRWRASLRIDPTRDTTRRSSSVSNDAISAVAVVGAAAVGCLSITIDYRLRSSHTNKLGVIFETRRVSNVG